MTLSKQKIASVLVKGINSALDYNIPDDLICEIGHEVQITIGKRETTGWVVEIKSEAFVLNKIKSQQSFGFEQNQHQIKDIISSSKVFLPDQLKLFKWMADYYGCELVNVIETAIPKRVRTKKRKTKEHKAIFTYQKPDKLSSKQEAAINSIIKLIEKKEFQTNLLYGVTGSGKTEVYLTAIEKCLELGGTALSLIHI